MRNSTPEKVTFTKHLATMIKAGIPIGEALASLAEQSWSPQFKRAVKGILASVNNGTSLAKSLSAYPGIFDRYYVSFVEVGEESGTLEENLSYLSGELYKDHLTRMRVESAMIYPAIVLSATFIIGGGISLFVLPKLVDLFGAFDVELPLATQILLGVASFMKTSGVLVVVSALLLLTGLTLIVRLPLIKPIWNRLALAIPILGPITSRYQITRLCRNLGTLLKSGVPIAKALEITAKTLTNMTYSSALGTCLDDVERGRPLSEPLSKNRLFPSLLTKMAQVGEKSGKLDESFLYLGDYYDEELENITKNLTTVLEPVLLLVLGILVAFVAIAIISPIYQLTGSIGQ